VGVWCVCCLFVEAVKIFAIVFIPLYHQKFSSYDGTEKMLVVEIGMKWCMIALIYYSGYYFISYSKVRWRRIWLFRTIRKSINSTVSMGSLISATAARGALEDMADLVRPSKYFHGDHRNGHYDNVASKNSTSHRKSNNTSGPLATISVPSAGDVDDRIKHAAPQKEIYSSPFPTGRVDDFGLFHKTLTVDKLLSELMFAPNRVNDVCCLSKLMGVYSSSVVRVIHYMRLVFMEDWILCKR
jgi:hypothetical protein